MPIAFNDMILLCWHPEHVRKIIRLVEFHYELYGGGCESGVASHQDERELKRQTRKQSNRESARRSRLRKQMLAGSKCFSDSRNESH
nr:G-box-binding factor 1-like isoform X1 [Tanacetum cinerariifolium]